MVRGVASILGEIVGSDFPINITAYDGSTAGDHQSQYMLRVKSDRALNYLLTAPGDLGLARAYLQGEVVLEGVHPGNPYDAFATLRQGLNIAKPSVLQFINVLREVGFDKLYPLPAPQSERQPRWQRVVSGFRHSHGRDAQAIDHHYNVSNTFYEYLLGKSMCYTCAVYPDSSAALDEAQENKLRLVFDKLNLKPGDRLLDVGCGWGSMVRYAARRGVLALGVTLSQDQATWAQEAIKAEGLGDYAEVRFGDYRHIQESNFDAISSIGLTEHIGVKNYPAYFSFVSEHLKPHGTFLNHCITRAHNKGSVKAGAFIDRYIFPDGELTGSGTVIVNIQNVGDLEVVHSENLREHYAMTLRDWNENLVKHWDEAVAEIGEEKAKLWGLYIAACRAGFEANSIQLHQVLVVKNATDSRPNYALRPWWKP